MTPFVDNSQSNLQDVHSEIIKNETDANATKAKIRAIDPARLGESRHMEWVPEWFSDLICKIRTLVYRSELGKLEYNLNQYGASLDSLRGRVTQLQTRIKQLERQASEQHKQAPKAEVPFLTTAVTTALTAGTVLALGASAPVAAGAALVAGIATEAYQWWCGHESTPENVAAPHTVLDTPAARPVASKEIVSQFLQSMPAAKNEQVAAFLDKLCNVPAGTVVEEDGDTLTITLPKAPKLVLDKNQRLTREQVEALEAHYPDNHRVETFSPVADVRIRDLKRFGSIGPKAWKGAKDGIQLAKTIKLRKDGNTLYIEGVPNIAYVTFPSASKLEVKATSWGVPLPLQTYPIQDYDRLVSFLHA